MHNYCYVLLLYGMSFAVIDGEQNQALAGVVTGATGGLTTGLNAYSAAVGSMLPQFQQIAGVTAVVRDQLILTINAPSDAALNATMPTTNIAEQVDYLLSIADAAPEASLGTRAAAALDLSTQGETAMSTAESTAAATAAATVATIVIGIIIMIAVETMPYWLPLIYQQSGMVNNTLYEARAFIDFQGAVGTACSRSSMLLYPYNRKDLGGRSWQEVGGDRGRSCLPRLYTAQVYIPSGVSVILQSSYHDATKHVKIFSMKSLQRGRFDPIEWHNS